MRGNAGCGYGATYTRKGIDAVMQMSRKADVGQRMHERGAK